MVLLVPIKENVCALSTVTLHDKVLLQLPQHIKVCEEVGGQSSDERSEWLQSEAVQNV
jgi:hypothetical protein